MEESVAFKYVEIESIKELPEKEDVYCIGVEEIGNFIANGMVISNCDALRYAVVSAFPDGEFDHPDENISYEQLRRNVFGEQQGMFMNPGNGGYF